MHTEKESKQSCLMMSSRSPSDACWVNGQYRGIKSTAELIAPFSEIAHTCTHVRRITFDDAFVHHE